MAIYTINSPYVGTLATVTASNSSLGIVHDTTTLTPERILYVKSSTGVIKTYYGHSSLQVFSELLSKLHLLSTIDVLLDTDDLVDTQDYLNTLAASYSGLCLVCRGDFYKMYPVAATTDDAIANVFTVLGNSWYTSLDEYNPSTGATTIDVGGSGDIATSVATDMYDANVVLQVRSDTTNSDILDDKGNVFVSSVGASDKATYSTNVVKYYDKSMSFMTPSTLSTSHLNAFDFGTGDFTIELWVYKSSTSTTQYTRILQIGTNTTANSFYLLASHGYSDFHPYIDTYSTSYTSPIPTTATYAVNTWHHVAVSRQSDVWRLFINGNLVTSATVPGIVVSSQALYIGGNQSGQESFVGYLDDIRITKGIARYTASFTPAPITPQIATDYRRFTYPYIYNALEYKKYGYSKAPQASLSSYNWTTSFTVGVAARLTAASTTILRMQASGQSDSWKLHVTATGYIALTVNNTATYTSTTKWRINDQNLVLVTISASTLTIHVNGTVTDINSTAIAANPALLGDLYIGEGVIGTVQQVFRCNPLTSAQIQMIDWLSMFSHNLQGIVDGVGLNPMAIRKPLSIPNEVEPNAIYYVPVYGDATEVHQHVSDSLGRQLYQVS